MVYVHAFWVCAYVCAYVMWEYVSAHVVSVSLLTFSGLIILSLSSLVTGLRMCFLLFSGLHPDFSLRFWVFLSLLLQAPFPVYPVSLDHLESSVPIFHLFFSLIVLILSLLLSSLLCLQHLTRTRTLLNTLHIHHRPSQPHGPSHICSAILKLIALMFLWRTFFPTHK